MPNVREKLYKNLKEYKTTEGQTVDLIPKYQSFDDFNTAMNDRSYRQKLHRYLSAKELLPKEAESFVQFEKDIIGDISKPSGNKSAGDYSFTEPSQAKQSPKQSQQVYTGSPLTQKEVEKRDVFGASNFISPESETPVDGPTEYAGPLTEKGKKIKTLEELVSPDPESQSLAAYEDIHGMNLEELRGEIKKIDSQLFRGFNAPRDVTAPGVEETLRNKLIRKKDEIQSYIKRMEDPDSFKAIDPDGYINTLLGTNVDPTIAYEKTRNLVDKNTKALKNSSKLLNTRVAGELGLPADQDLVELFNGISEAEVSDAGVKPEYIELKNKLLENKNFAKLVKMRNKLEEQNALYQRDFAVEKQISDIYENERIKKDALSKSGEYGKTGLLGDAYVNTMMKIADAMSYVGDAIQSASAETTGYMIPYGKKAQIYNSLVESGMTDAAEKFRVSTYKEDMLKKESERAKYGFPSSMSASLFEQNVNVKGVNLIVENGEVIGARDKEGYLMQADSPEVKSAFEEYEKNKSKYEPSRLENLRGKGRSALATTTQIIMDMVPIFATSAISGGTSVGVGIGSGMTMFPSIYKDAIRSGQFDNMKSAAAYSAGMAAAMAFVEAKVGKLEANLGKALNKADYVADFERLSVDLANGKINPRQFTAEGIKSFYKRASQDVPSEILEEVSSETLNQIGNISAGIQDDFNVESIAEAVVFTPLATMPIGSLTALINGNEFKNEIRSAAKDTKKFFNVVDKLVANGDITQEQANETKTFFNNIKVKSDEYKALGADAWTQGVATNLLTEIEIEKRRLADAKTEIAKKRSQGRIDVLNKKLSDLEARIESGQKGKSDPEFTEFEDVPPQGAEQPKAEVTTPETSVEDDLESIASGVSVNQGTAPTAQDVAPESQAAPTQTESEGEGIALPKEETTTKLSELNGKKVRYKGKIGVLSIDEGGKITIDTGNTIYDIDGNSEDVISDFNIKIPTNKEIVLSDNDNVVVDGLNYKIETDLKGNITSLIGENGKSIKDTETIVEVEIKRNQTVDNPFVANKIESNPTEIISSVTTVSPVSVEPINFVLNENMNDTVDSAIDKLFDGKEVTEQELLQVEIYTEDAVERLENLKKRLPELSDQIDRTINGIYAIDDLLNKAKNKTDGKTKGKEDKPRKVVSKTPVQQPVSRGEEKGTGKYEKLNTPRPAAEAGSDIGGEVKPATPTPDVSTTTKAKKPPKSGLKVSHNGTAYTRKGGVWVSETGKKPTSVSLMDILEKKAELLQEAKAYVKEEGKETPSEGDYFVDTKRDGSEQPYVFENGKWQFLNNKGQKQPSISQNGVTEKWKGAVPTAMEKIAGKEPTRPVPTNANTLNKEYAKLKEKYGNKEAKKIYDNAIRLVNPNTNEIVEIRGNGVVTKEGDKYIFRPYLDTDFKTWRLGTRKNDVTDQFSEVEKEEVPQQERKNKVTATITLDKGMLSTIKKTPIFQTIFSKQQMDSLVEGENIVELNMTAWGKAERMLGAKRTTSGTEKGKEPEQADNEGKGGRETEAGGVLQTPEKEVDQDKSLDDDLDEIVKEVKFSKEGLTIDNVDTAEDSGVEVKSSSSSVLSDALNDFKAAGETGKIKAILALKNLMPSLKNGGIKLVVHTSSRSMLAAQKKRSEAESSPVKGFYDPKTNEIHLNLERLSNDTPVHEFLHPIISVLGKNNTQALKNLADQVKNDPILGKELDRFIEERYSGNDKEKTEEKVVTFLGYKVSEILSQKNLGDKTNEPILRRIVRLFKEFLQDLGLPVNTWNVLGSIDDRTPILGLAASLADAIALGKTITFDGKARGGMKKSLLVWHGSPYNFDRFSTENVGTFSSESNDIRYSKEPEVDQESREEKVKRVSDEIITKIINKRGANGDLETSKKIANAIYKLLEDNGIKLNQSEKDRILASAKDANGYIPKETEEALGKVKGRQRKTNQALLEEIASQMGINLEDTYKHGSWASKVLSAIENGNHISYSQAVNKVKKGQGLSEDEYFGLVVAYHNKNKEISSQDAILKTTEDPQLKKEAFERKDAIILEQSEIGIAIHQSRSQAGSILGSGAFYMFIPELKTPEQIFNDLDELSGGTLSKNEKQVESLMAEVTRLSELQKELSEKLRQRDEEIAKREEQIKINSAKKAAKELKDRVSSIKNKTDLKNYAKQMTKSGILKSVDEDAETAEADPKIVRTKFLLGAIKVALQNGINTSNFNEISAEVNKLIQEINSENGTKIRLTDSNEIIDALAFKTSKEIDTAKAEINNKLSALRSQAAAVKKLEKMLNALYSASNENNISSTTIKDAISKIKEQASKKSEDVNKSPEYVKIADEIRELMDKIDLLYNEYVKNGDKENIKKAIQKIELYKKESNLASANKKLESQARALESNKTDSGKDKAKKNIDGILEILTEHGIIKKRTRVEYDKEVQARIKTITQRRRRLSRLAQKAEEMSKKGELAKAGDIARDVLFNFFRTFKVTFDMSAPLTKGGLALGRLILSGAMGGDGFKIIRNAYADAFNAMADGYRGSEATAIKFYETISKNGGEIYEQLYGLKLDHPFDPELTDEFFQSSIATGFGKQLNKINANFFQGSESHMVTYINAIRFAMFDSFYKANPTASAEELKAYAEHINNITGTTNANLGKTFGNIVNSAFLAFKYMVSRWKVLAGALNVSDYERALKGDVVAQEKLKNLLSATVSIISALGITALALGDDAEVDLDPYSSEFLKLLYKDNAYDLTFGVGAIIRMFANTIGVLHYLISPNTLSDINRARFQSLHDKGFGVISPLGKYLYERANPVVGTLAALTSGKNYVGEPYKPFNWQHGLGGTSMILDQVTPIFISSLLKDVFFPTDESSISERIFNTLYSSQGGSFVNYQNAIKDVKVKQALKELDISINKKVKLGDTSNIDKELKSHDYFEWVWKNEVKNLIGKDIIIKLSKGIKLTKKDLDGIVNTYKNKSEIKNRIKGQLRRADPKEYDRIVKESKEADKEKEAAKKDK